MDEELRRLGARLFIYSPRQIDADNRQVSGLLIENGQFVSATKPVPHVNGSWFIGRDRSKRPSMGALQFRNWAAENGIDIYPLQAFSKVLKDKLKTSRMIRGFDPALHPLTEVYDLSLEQLSRFIQRYRLVFIKPRFGSKGNDIFSIRRTKSGLRCAYYADRQKQEVIHATPADALATINRTVGNRSFVIQQGITIDKHDDAPFIFRVIMLDDGEQWQWVHKTVLAAPNSDIANTTQGGSNWKTVDLLEQIYGADKASELFDILKRVSFDCTRHLDKLFPGKLMEVAFDFVLNSRQQLKVLEINTLPGMTKPGLPPEPAFADILNLTPQERDVYEQLVLPHGSCLARFLYTRLQEHQAASLRSGVDSTNLDTLSSGVDGSAPDTRQDDRIVDPVGSLLEQAIDRQARHLLRACLANGAFHYRDNVGIEVGVDRRFDTLEQVGAIFALDLYDQWRPSAEVREAALRAVEFLKANYIAPIPGEKGLLAIWSRSEFNQMGKPDQIRLGWVALGLIALLCFERQNPGSTSLEEFRALGEFLRWGQNADGSFRSLFLPDQGGWKSGWKSLNYPGEAAVALLMLHDLDPSSGWAQAASDALAYLVSNRRNKAKIQADYWLLMATDRLLPVFDECKTKVDRRQLIDHARQVCDSILREQIQASKNPLRIGGFDPRGRTEPTATRLQGLLAARGFLKAEDPLFDERLQLALRDGVNFLIRACVSDCSIVEAMPRSIRSLSTRKPGPARTAKPQSSDIRLDDVQQALIAMIRYREMLGDTESNSDQRRLSSTNDSES